MDKSAILLLTTVTTTPEAGSAAVGATASAVTVDGVATVEAGVTIAAEGEEDGTMEEGSPVAMATTTAIGNNTDICSPTDRYSSGYHPT